MDYEPDDFGAGDDGDEDDLLDSILSPEQLKQKVVADLLAKKDAQRTVAQLPMQAPTVPQVSPPKGAASPASMLGVGDRDGTPMQTPQIPNLGAGAGGYSIPPMAAAQALSGSDGQPTEDLLASLSPQELQQLVQLGTVDDRDLRLQQQMAHSQALSHPYRGDGDTVPGAFWGGLANGIGAIKSGKQMEGLQRQEQGLTSEREAGRKLYMDILRRKLAGKPVPKDELDRAAESSPDEWSMPDFGQG